MKMDFNVFIEGVNLIFFNWIMIKLVKKLVIILLINFVLILFVKYVLIILGVSLGLFVILKVM